MPNSNLIKRIVWAVDPFVTKPELQIHTARALSLLTKGLEVEVEPVCVLTHRHLKVPVRSYSSDRLIGGGGPLVTEVMTPTEALKQWAGDVDLPGMLEPKCLVLDTPSLQSSVLKLLQYAVETKTDLIAVSTRAREGLLRFLMGSFAESLTLESLIPLFIVNPHAEPKQKYQKILFPTAASEKSEESFQKVISIASKLKASVTVFHKISYLVEDNSFEEPSLEVAESRAKLNGWKGIAADSDVECEIFFEGTPGNTAESILRYANQRKLDLIAMESIEKPIAAALLGGVTRQVVRHAECPVLLFQSRRELL